MALPVALLKVCGEMGRELTPAHAQRLAVALDEHSGRAGADLVVATVPTAHVQAVVKRLLNAWSDHPKVSGSELGTALAASTYAHQAARSEPHLEFVLSGPSSQHVHARITDQVLLNLIDSAQESLLLVTFSLHMYAELKDALKAAIGRGVVITVLAEDPKDRDKFDQDPAYALAGLLITRWRWPRDQRAPGMTSLHAKVAVADDHTVLISSANLSEKASGANLEAGLLLRGGDWARRASEHFASLRSQGVLVDT